MVDNLTNMVQIELQDNAPTIANNVINYVSYQAFIHYNYVMDTWTADFYKLTNTGKQPVVCGLVLEPFLNIFEGREYLGLGEFYVLPRNENQRGYVEPNANNISQAFYLVWGY